MHLYQFVILLMVALSLSNCNNSPSEETKLWTEADRSYLITHMDRTQKELLQETQALSNHQWTILEDSSRWSIAQIVEHLVLQEEAYYRELSVIAASPPRSEWMDQVKGNDEKFLAYAYDPTPGTTGWYAQPMGRFCNTEDALTAFSNAREKAIELIQKANTDFRQQFTFRNIPKEKIDTNTDFYTIREVRDLHQLILNNIAHTDRHLSQIRKVKRLPLF